MSTHPTPESVQFLRDFMVSRIHEEHACTNRVFDTLPDSDWRPDPKARSVRELAWHIACSERWFLDCLGKRKFEGGNEGPLPAKVSEISAFYNDGLEAALTAVSALTGEQLLQTTDFGRTKLPLYALLNFCLVHVIHHRGQLSTYIRPLGGRVPSIYGSSADTPAGS